MDSYSLTLMLPGSLEHFFGASMQLNWEAPWVRIVVVSFCLMAGVGAVYALRRRHAVAATRLSAGGFWRLGTACVVALSGGLAVAGIGCANILAHGFVHPERSPISDTPAMVGVADYETVSFPSTDGLTLRGWYVPSHNGAAVICVHGFGGNRSHWLKETKLLAGQGYGVLLFDLRNSGESDGEMTTLGVREVDDVHGAVDFLLGRPEVDARRIGVIGHSMGGATVILAAARIPQISAVVAESAYARLEDNLGLSVKNAPALRPFLPIMVFFGERDSGIDVTQVRPVESIALISPRPILLVHGVQDDMIPVSNVYALYAAAREPKELYVLDQAGHSNFWQAEPEGYPQHLIGFLNESLLTP